MRFTTRRSRMDAILRCHHAAIRSLTDKRTAKLERQGLPFGRGAGRRPFGRLHARAATRNGGRAEPPDVGSHRPAGAFVLTLNHAGARASACVTDDWSDVLGALAASGARFLVVGAHAMAVHGVPRGTQDLDVWIDPDGKNAERVWRGLAAFGAPLDELGVTREDLSRPGTVIQLGLPPNRIDLLTGISGIPDFETAWADRVEHGFGGRQVPFIGRATLIKNKRESGRRKDLVDLEALGELPP